MPRRSSTPSSISPAARAARQLEDFRALRRRAELSVAHQGQGRRRLLDRLGRPRRGADALLGAGPGLLSAPRLGRPSGARAGWSRSSATPRWTRATSTRPDRGLQAGHPQPLVDRRLQPPEPRRGRSARASGHKLRDDFRQLRLGGRRRSSTAGSRRRPSPSPAASALRAWIEACPNQLYSRADLPGRRGLAQAAARRSRRPGRGLAH